MKTETKEREPYTLEEEVALLRMMDVQRAPLQYQVLIQFMIFCGMRRGEVLGLEWKDINFDTGVCSIRRTSLYSNAATGTYTSTPKTKSSRRSIKLSQEFLQTLRRYKLQQNTDKVQAGDFWYASDRLFTNLDGKPMNPERPYNWLKKFCEQYNLPFKGLHNFRHAFASEMIASGQIDVRTVSALLGHAHASTTLNIYAHEVQAASANAMHYMSDLIHSKCQNS